MTIRWSLRRWSSLAKPRLQAAELLPAPADGDALTVALQKVSGDLDGAAFLVVRIDGLSRSGLEPALQAFRLAADTTRLCLAASRTSLARLDPASFDFDQVGLMLDDVDASTPLADLIWDGIEAVRFNADFVTAAARNVRLGCALESMLGLARELGLCTLGSDAMPDGAALAGRAEFDYLPDPGAEKNRTRSPHPPVEHFRYFDSMSALTSSGSATDFSSR